MEIRKGMPGLKQPERIANDRLATHLATFGYRPVPLTPSLWTHDTHPVDFSLVVDNFGFKYDGKEHALHLLKALRHLYTVTEDWDDTLFTASPSNGTMPNNTLTFPCQTTSPLCCTSSNT
jgi:hypothetical protein